MYLETSLPDHPFGTNYQILVAKMSQSPEAQMKALSVRDIFRLHRNTMEDMSLPMRLRENITDQKWEKLLESRMQIYQDCVRIQGWPTPVVMRQQQSFEWLNIGVPLWGGYHQTWTSSGRRISTTHLG